jgi:hypothetical protein
MSIDIPQHKDSLKFSRDELPQIKSDDVDGFLNHLKRKGIDHQRKIVNPSRMRATQNEFNIDKVRGMMANKHLSGKPSLSSKDNYILDGHHRWLVDHNKKQHHNTIEIDLPIKELIKHAHGYGKSFVKSISEQMMVESETHGWIDHEGKWRGTSQGKLHYDLYMAHLKDKHPKDHETIEKLGGNDWRQLNGLAIRHAKKNGWLHTYIDADGYGMIAGERKSFERHKSAVDSLKKRYSKLDVTHIHESKEN